MREIHDLPTSKLRCNVAEASLDRLSSQLIWYCNVSEGEKYICISLDCKHSLSQRHTNHLLRVTSLQLFDDAQIDACKIIWVRGHRDTNGFLNYAHRLSTVRKRNISSILSNSVSACPPPSTPTRPFATQITVLQLPTIGLDVDLVKVPDDIGTFISSIPDELLFTSREKQSSVKINEMR